MLRNNFEEHIKEKLDNRSINPSDKAWGKLSERLDSQENNKNNKPYWWLGIAASIIGVILVVSQFLNNEPQELNIKEIVDSPVNEQNSTIKIAKEDLEVKDFNITKEDINIKEKESLIKPKANNIIKENNTSEIEAVAIIPKKETSVQENKVATKSVEILKEELSFEDQKIQDVIAQVQALKKNNKEVTDTEIDALLLEAQKEIRLKKLYNETTGIVDANILLQDVEAELDQSFRKKVLDALKASYNSVKTAVAERND